MKCPKCGYERQPRDNQYVPATECPACGIVYAKSGPAPDFGGRTFSGPLSGRPSPLDEASLKKARERVEIRLRKQLEARVKDDKHARTLERARQITSLALQKRRAMKQDTEKPVEKQEIAVTPARPAAPLLDAEEEPIVNLVDIAVKGGTTESAADAPKEAASAPSDTEPAENAATSPPEPQPEPPPQAVAVEPPPKSAMTAEPPEKKQPKPPREPAAPENNTEDEHVVSLANSRNQKVKPEKDAAASPVPIHGHADGYHPLPRKAGGGLIRLLPAIAWMILLAGIIGAVLSWTTIKDVEASLIATPVPNLKTLPIGLLLGFAYLATGVLGFAFFWVSSLISRQLRDIRHLLVNLPLPRLAAEREDAPWVDGENDAEA